MNLYIYKLFHFNKLLRFFILELSAVKVFNKYENDKQLVEISIDHKQCLFLFINGKRVPNVNKIFIKSEVGKREIAIKAIGFFQVKSVFLTLEPSIYVRTHFPRQLYENYKIETLNERVLYHKKPNKVSLNNLAILKVKGIKPCLKSEFHIKANNLKFKEIKSKLIYKNTSLNQIPTNQS